MSRINSKKRKNTGEATSKPGVDPREEHDLLLSLRQIALLVGKDRKHVVRILTDARMPHTTYRRGYPVWHLARVWQAFRRPEQMTDEELEEMHPQDRATWLKGELLKNKLAHEASRFVTAEDYAREVARQNRLISAALTRIPEVLAKDCGLTPTQITVVDRHLDKLRSAIGPPAQ